MPPIDKNESTANPPGIPLVETQHLARRRPGSDGWLLADVNLAIRAGECTALVGPTGAGKTVLLRAIAGLDPIDSGCVLWRGQPVRASQTCAYRSHVAYLHQRPTILPSTVEYNLRAPFSLHVHSKKRFDVEQINAWLGQLGRIPDFLERQTRDLSGGERQLVALLRALQLGPSVLLLDEPTAAMDRELALTVERWIATWISEAPADRAAVWVSHDDRQVSRVSQRAIRMDHGRVLTPEE